MTCLRWLDRLAAVLGMHGRAAAWPMRSITGSITSRLERRGVTTCCGSDGSVLRRRRETASLLKTNPDSEYASTAAVAKSRMPKISSCCVSSMSNPLHFHRDDFPDPQQSRHLEHQRGPKEVNALRIVLRVNQHRRVATVHDVENHEKNDRQHDEDVANQPALRGDGRHVLLQADAGAHYVADVGEHL